jgi:Domain of unknown function (DUF5753)
MTVRTFIAFSTRRPLRRHVGGSAVMRVQLERIAEVARSPKVTFQFIPLDLGAHPGMDGTFVILEWFT